MQYLLNRAQTICCAAAASPNASAHTPRGQSTAASSRQRSVGSRQSSTGSRTPRDLKGAKEPASSRHSPEMHLRGTEAWDLPGANDLTKGATPNVLLV